MKEAGISSCKSCQQKHQFSFVLQVYGLHFFNMLKIDYHLKHLNSLNETIVQIHFIIYHRNKDKMVRCQYISMGLNVHNRFKQENSLLKYEIPEYEKNRKILEILKN